MKLNDLKSIEYLLTKLEPAVDHWAWEYDNLNNRKIDMIRIIKNEIKNYKDNEVRILESVTWSGTPITKLATAHIQRIIKMLGGWAVDRKYRGGVHSKIYNGQTIESMIVALKWELNRRYGR